MIWAERVRGALVFLWPFLASLAVMAVIVAAGAVVLSALDRDIESELLARDVRQVAQEAKAASDTNRQILEQIRPCVIGDPADSPACVAQARRDQVVADAIAQIQHQHDEVLSRLSSLLSRPAQRTTVVRQTAPVSPGVRAAPGGTSTAPGAPTATQPAPEPSPTTTACDQRGKSGRCR